MSTTISKFTETDVSGFFWIYTIAKAKMIFRERNAICMWPLKFIVSNQTEESIGA